MGKINSKQKGSAFERDLAKILESRFGEGFRRVPYSGAMFGGKNFHRSLGQRDDVKEIMSGDLIAPEKFPFTVEAKFYKDLAFHQILEGKCTLLDTWIAQAEQNIVLSKKELLLVIKLNNKGIFVCFNEKLLNEPKIFENRFHYGKYVVISMNEFLHKAQFINTLVDWKIEESQNVIQELPK